jgi:glyoxylase-like metal-dependent hydrolase (beta-lactamase superfamily II)
MPGAHTDGDTVVAFRRGDVIATGDLIEHHPLARHRCRARRQPCWRNRRPEPP